MVSPGCSSPRPARSIVRAGIFVTEMLLVCLAVAPVKAADEPAKPVAQAPENSAEPQDAKGFIARAKARLVHQNFAGAIADTTEAISLEPDNAEAANVRG